MLFLLAQMLARGQTYERTRKLVETYAALPNTEIQVLNKYGNVHMVSWDMDSVRFEIDVIVKGNKESKIQKNYDMIDFDFTVTDFYILAQTTFKSDKGAFWDEVSGLANTIFSGSNRTQINYKVYIPESCPLKIENKFGNVYIGDQNARADIAISNGDLKANNFNAALKLEINFGNANIRSIREASITTSYAEIEIKKAEKLNLESKSSTYNISLLDEVNVESRRDKITIEEVGVIRGELSFSDLKIEYFSNISVLNSNYGILDFQTILPTFKQIRLDAKYTDIDLNFESNTVFRFDLQHNDKTAISLPESAINVDKKKIEEKEGLYKTTGSFGSGSKLPLVEIKIEAGQIFIRNF